MKTKQIVRPIIDVAMCLLLPLLMAYSLIGEALHEWLGVAMLLLFVVHHLLNVWWYKSITKGKWTTERVVFSLLDVLLLADILSLALSGIIISQHVFAFLKISVGMSFARTLHLLGSYWGLILMSLHLGLHWSSAMNATKKALHLLNSSTLRTVLLRAVAATLSIYGSYAFITRQIGSYLLLQNQFVFLDFDEPLIFFLADYIAVIALFVCAGYYMLALIKKLAAKRSAA